MTVVLTLVILLSILAPAMAGEDITVQGGNVSTAPLSEQGPTDPTELEAFLDKLMAKDVEEYHIAGAAVSVVKDGMLYLPKATATRPGEGNTR